MHQNWWKLTSDMGFRSRCGKMARQRHLYTFSGVRLYIIYIYLFISDNFIYMLTLSVKTQLKSFFVICYFLQKKNILHMVKNIW